ncbi:unnamed protein product [marine sediment metagenome]|uniref:Uncharacterized protein n=1 Tax=marine sediment metagenome TaxID=412755 RepID=X0TL77_9ZZZZ
MPRRRYEPEDVAEAVASWIRVKATGQIVIHYNCGGITNIYENKKREPGSEERGGDDETVSSYV